MAMRKKRTRILTMISSVVLLFVACIVLILFYPYTDNFTAFPRITQTQSGADGDPINMVFVGSQEQILHSFQKAGWLIADPITPQTAEKIAANSLAHSSYPTAPVSNLSVFGRVQDLAFEQPTNDVQKRGHIRLWKTGTLIGGQLVWVGQAPMIEGLSSVGPPIFPPITLLQPLTRKEMQWALTWKKPVWSQRNLR